MSEQSRKEHEPAQEQQDDRLSLDKETLKDLDPKSDDQVRGGLMTSSGGGKFTDVCTWTASTGA